MIAVPAAAGVVVGTRRGGDPVVEQGDLVEA